MTRCTEACRRAVAEAEARRAAWVARWPSYCRECDGWGGRYCSGGWEEPPSVDPCEVCACRDRCGRCGEEGLIEGEGPCSECGWSYDDGLPSPAECACWLGEEVDLE